MSVVPYLSHQKPSNHELYCALLKECNSKHKREKLRQTEGLSFLRLQGVRSQWGVGNVNSLVWEKYKVANALEVLLQSFDISILAVGVKVKCLRISGHLHVFLVA